MNDALLGVVIGGLIGSVVPIATLAFDYRKWKKEKRLAILQSKRDRLERQFKDISDSIAAGMQKNSYSIEALSTVAAQCPPAVLEAVDAMMFEKDKTAEQYRHHFLLINTAMKKELVCLDNAIELLVQ